jgi:nucleoside-diphosphate-sugar epimerase
LPVFLVTGIAGFIGSALAHELVQRGHEVRGIDNLATGFVSNLAGLETAIRFFEADILDADVLREACNGVDFVLHEAALGSVPRSLEDPARSNRANVDGTLAVLIAAREARVKRVVYASSSSAYGNTPTLPKHEAMPADPISPYAVSKYSGELYVRSFHRVFGVETVALRYFNVFGPRQNPDSPYSAVLSKFITLMLRGERPTIHGDGVQTRDFTFVANVVHANLLACLAPAENVAGRMFNIACSANVSLNRTFELLKNITGFEGEPIYAPERAGDVHDSLADISAANKAMGYAPLVMFEEGLRRTVDWYRSRSKASGTAHVQNASQV